MERWHRYRRHLYRPCRRRSRIGRDLHRQGTFDAGEAGGCHPRSAELVLRAQAGAPDQLSLLAHGTTVATNALLEEKGVKAGLLITAGFRAVYPARAGTRPRGGDLIDPHYRKAAPLIPLALTCEIPERIGFDGRVLRPLDRDAVRSRRAAAETGRMPGNRDLLSVLVLCATITSGRRPRSSGRNVRISASRARARCCPVIREFPRLSTVVLDAYVGPVVSAYFTELGERASAQGVNLDRTFIMQSNGGLMRLNIASAFPNETLLSGPAAGIGFATALAQQIGETGRRHLRHGRHLDRHLACARRPSGDGESRHHRRPGDRHIDDRNPHHRRRRRCDRPYR